MAKISKEIWSINNVQIPVRIYRERRRNNRISIAKDAVNLRIPNWGASILQGGYKRWAYDWLVEQFIKDPSLKERFTPKVYKNGDEFRTHFEVYKIFVTRSKRATSTSKLELNTIFLNLNQDISILEESKTTKTLIARMIAQKEHPRVLSRIQDINEKYFGKLTITGVRIKNNSSNWGSCSVKGNLNVSTKTLFAPAFVQDYIFVHELAHRIEMNHSANYWKIVEKVMPDYKQAEKWIKIHGKECDF
ncbi:MAG: putative metal-dependent hydrolase [Saprospiraceae bacterium]|jgi:predicted metal-dependent hydrolase